MTAPRRDSKHEHRKPRLISFRRGVSTNPHTHRPQPTGRDHDHARGQRRPPLLEGVGHHDDNGVGVGQPHVAHVAVGP